MTRLRHTTESVGAIFRDLGVEPTFQEYTTPSQRLSFYCSCPERRIGETTLRAVYHQGIRPLCSACRTFDQQRRMRANRRQRPLVNKSTKLNIKPVQARLSIPEVAAMFAAHGVTILTEDCDRRSPIRFICPGPCGGTIHGIRLSALKAGKVPRCPECARAALPRNESHPRWNEDISDETRAKRRPDAIRQWMAAVRENYDRTCAISGMPGSAAHHLYSYDRNPKLRLVAENGVWLTRRLHREFHQLYGYGDNTFDQFAEFFETTTGQSCPIVDPLDINPNQLTLII